MKKLFLLVGLVVFLTPMVASAKSNNKLEMLSDKEFEKNCMSWSNKVNKNNISKKYDGYYRGTIDYQIFKVCISNHKVKIGRGLAYKGSVDSRGNFKGYQKGGNLVVGKIENNAIYVNDKKNIEIEQDIISKKRENETSGPTQDSQQDNQLARKRSTNQQQKNIPWDSSTGYGVSGYEKNKGWVDQAIRRNKTIYGF